MYCEGDLILTYEGESLLQYLRDRDGALMLSPELFSPSGIQQLRNFLQQYDAETAVAVICSVLSRGMIGVTHENGCITSWRYFEGSIREEMEAIFRQFNSEGARFR